MSSPPRYPGSFLWGAAFSAHQTEGVAGGGEGGDWYRFEHETRDGKPTIASGDTADRATDFWNRHDEDFREARAIGLSTLRTSIAWEKVNPAPGVFRADVLEHYGKIFDSMRAHGIRPMIALHHFTHPTWFHERGGWLSSEGPDLFLEYATHVVDHLGDRCDLWITFNEPMILAEMGYLKGIVPPLRASLTDTYEAAYQLARAHRKVATMIHAKQGPSPNAGGELRGVGLAHAGPLHDPLDPQNPKDREAAEVLANLSVWDFLVAVTGDRLTFRMPAEVPGGASFDRAFPADEPPALDWLGVNYYTRWLISYAAKSKLRVEWHAPTSEHGDNGWPIAPEGLGRVLLDASARFPHLPLIVTENGLADARDDRRPAFLRAALASLDEVIGKIDVRGYYHWALTDNFEWLDGYRMRFGLVEIRYDQGLARVPRPSAGVYAQAIRERSQGR